MKRTRFTLASCAWDTRTPRPAGSIAAFFLSFVSHTECTVWGGALLSALRSLIDRWGDAPIKTLALQLFVPESRIRCFKGDIAYAHPKSECDYCEAAPKCSCGGCSPGAQPRG